MENKLSVAVKKLELICYRKGIQFPSHQNGILEGVSLDVDRIKKPIILRANSSNKERLAEYIKEAVKELKEKDQHV